MPGPMIYSNGQMVKDQFFDIGIFVTSIIIIKKLVLYVWTGSRVWRWSQKAERGEGKDRAASRRIGQSDRTSLSQ